MKKSNKTIGIDLGTTNSAVSIFEKGEYKIIPNKEGKNTTPSIVAFTDKGEILVGETAKRQAITNPEDAIFSIKRIMGLMYNEDNAKKAKEKVPYHIIDKNGSCAVEIQGKIYTPQEISAKILMKLKGDAEEFLGEEIVDAVITVPAYFNDSQRKATKEAGTIAGLNVKRIINEPTAASLAYGLDKKKEEKIIVFDAGGGTHDVSILDIGEGTFEVLATDGNAFLGGNDIDNLLTDFIINDFKAKEGVDLSNDRMAKQRIMDAAETLKKELSSTQESDVNLPFITANQSGPKHINMKVTRAKFEGLIEDFANKTISYIDVVLKESKVSKNDIEEIVMVGGTTRIPLIQQKVMDYFGGKKLNKSVNPDEVVAAGASIQGAILNNEVKDILLLDVTPLSLGLETLGGVMTKLIPKGTTIPYKKSEVFSTAENNQSAVDIHIVQGEREFAKDNKSLGHFQLSGIPAAPRGVPQIEVIFDVDSNGILNVTAKDKGTGKENNITITGSGGLSEEEINRMVKEAEINKEADKKRAEAIQKRNELDGLVGQIQKSITEMNMNSNDIPGLKPLLDKAERLVKEQSENKSEIVDTITQLQQLASQMMQQAQTMKNQGGCSTSQGCGSQQQKNDNEVIDAEVV